MRNENICTSSNKIQKDNMRNAVVAIYCHGSGGDVPALIMPPLQNRANSFACGSGSRAQLISSLFAQKITFSNLVNKCLIDYSKNKKLLEGLDRINNLNSINKL